MQKSTTTSPRLVAVRENIVTERPKVSTPYSFTAKPKLTSTTGEQRKYKKLNM